ncbi:MAG: alpha-amylase [Deltaproteobacteria bacterium]|nr:alpha-amylase [Deltaproteobacteria bacterium]
MKGLRKNPHIYQINLMTWLWDLSRRENKEICLNNIPEKEWQRLKELGMDLIWLMGMWERGPDSRKKARNELDLVNACRNILPDFQIEDIAGSPYAIHDYRPDPRFGSFKDLSALKKILEDNGLGLILDFVPNHTACDHPWIVSHPERYILDETDETGSCRQGFFFSGDSSPKRCIAHGKDPYFPSWKDTAQLNYAESGTLDCMSKTLMDLTAFCHGVRCDMAMLLLRDVFMNTWGSHLEKKKEMAEFWPFAIARVKDSGLEFLLMAETYWGMETDLLNSGFDYVYDKHLYDMMLGGSIDQIKRHISYPINHQEKMIRFLENHDETRALKAFGSVKIKGAMLVHATLPGMRLWQHGQFEGSQLRIPVQLRRAPAEVLNDELNTFGKKLLKEVNHDVFHEGTFRVCPTHGWPDNDSHVNLLAYSWSMGDEKRLIAANLSNESAQGYITIPDGYIQARGRLLLDDPLKHEKHQREALEITEKGLYVALESGEFHFFCIKGLK